MNDLQTLAPVPTPSTAEAILRPSDLFQIAVRGDHMQPTYRAGEHYLVMQPVDRFEYDGVYALQIDGEPLVYRCESNFRGGIHIQPDNRAYSAWTIPRAAFAQIVLGVCVGELHIRDRRAFGFAQRVDTRGELLTASARQ